MPRRSSIALWLAITTMLCCLPAAAGQGPKNVIMLIGDGMGLAQVTLARLSLSESSPPLNMDSMPYTAFVKTHSADATITDSAAAGTGLATGFKTNNGMISTLPNGRRVQTILEAAAGKGKATGLVTTVTITHATPAVFASHVESRKGEADIAPQLLANEVNVLLGGGRMFFIPKSQPQSKREDERDLIAEAKSAGYAFAETREALLSAKGDKLLGLFAASSMTTEPPEPSVAEMAGKAIEVLSKDKDGFFLMVEGGQIDYRCHDNDVVGTVKQMLDFDAAVGKALDFAGAYGDTLVIVTADHETGGLVIVYPDKDTNERFKVVWATKGHSGVNVPLFAEGPGAESFHGVLDNTDVPKKIAQVWGIKAFPKVLD
jgi:alkaline phosphatase